MVNRSVLILKYREPALRWVNCADPDEDERGIRLVDLNADRSAYLIDDADAANPEVLQRWLSENFQMLFETELASWYPDTDLWPSELDLDLFESWFEVESHSVVRDTVGTEIYDDD